jgi:hypothetical protein
MDRQVVDDHPRFIPTRHFVQSPELDLDQVRCNRWEWWDLAESEH